MGWPRDIVVEFNALCFGSPGSWVRILGVDLPLTCHAEVATHIQNKGRLAQMLAQGESSSTRKKKKMKHLGCLEMVRCFQLICLHRKGQAGTPFSFVLF